MLYKRCKNLVSPLVCLGVATLLQGCSGLSFSGLSPISWNQPSAILGKSSSELDQRSGVNDQSRDHQLSIIAEDFGSGSFLIARRVPAPMRSSESEALLAFSPVNVHIPAPAVDFKVSLSTLTGSFQSGSTQSQIALNQVDKKIKPGSYRVQLISSNPVWYAPDSYYQRRSLPAPPEGSIQRYLKGALGSHAIFFESSLALHSALEWSDDVGGIQVSDSLFEHLLDTIKVGDVVEILP